MVTKQTIGQHAKKGVTFHQVFHKLTISSDRWPDDKNLDISAFYRGWIGCRQKKSIFIRDYYFPLVWLSVQISPLVNALMAKIYGSTFNGSTEVETGPAPIRNNYNPYP